MVLTFGMQHSPTPIPLVPALLRSLLAPKFGAGPSCLCILIILANGICTPVNRRRATGSQASKPNSTRAAGAGGSSNTMLKLYTDDSPGLRVYVSSHHLSAPSPYVARRHLCRCAQRLPLFCTVTPSSSWSSPSRSLPPSSSSTSPPRSSVLSPSDGFDGLPSSAYGAFLVVGSSWVHECSRTGGSALPRVLIYPPPSFVGDSWYDLSVVSKQPLVGASHTIYLILARIVLDLCDPISSSPRSCALGDAIFSRVRVYVSYVATSMSSCYTLHR